MFKTSDTSSDNLEKQCTQNSQGINGLIKDGGFVDVVKEQIEFHQDSGLTC